MEVELLFAQLAVHAAREHLDRRALLRVAAAIGAGIKNHPVRAALSYWVRSHSYQIALAAPGAMRCDLSGAKVEAVDAQRAEEARKRLEDIAARKAAKRAPAP